jgi:hypothetical protein
VFASGLSVGVGLRVGLSGGGRHLDISIKTQRAAFVNMKHG